jgi:CBS domain-containing protein
MEFKDPVRSVLARKGWKVFSIPPETSVLTAVRQMADKDIGALAVIDGGLLVGLFSERDYARKIILHGRVSRETPVYEVMSSPAAFVTPDVTVDECLQIMTRNRVRHLPVVEDGRVIGIVSIGDLVNWVVSVQAETIGQLHSYIAGSYPG